MAHLPFHFLARAVILEDSRLLVNQFVGTSFTFLPGGHAEPGEGLQSALRRELSEELGVEATIGNYLGAVEYLWSHDVTGQQHYEVNHAFAVQAPLGSVVQSRDPSLHFQWVALDELEQYDLRPEPFRALVRRWAARD